MNPIIEREQAILHKALEALHKTTGIVGNVIEQPVITAQGVRPDARIELEVNGQRYPYLVEIKRIDRFATLMDVKYQCERYEPGGQPLLVAPRITPETAEKCREIDLQFIDTTGNAYLHGAGLYVLVKGQRPTEGEEFQLTDQEGKRAGTATHLRVIFGLLCKPELLNTPYRDIVQAAGVALGTIGWVFIDLNARGFVTGGKGKGDRVLLERQKLVREWVTNYPIKLRPKLNPKRFRAPKADWWKDVDIVEYGAQWGGEIAAAELTGYLRPHTLTIYLHKKLGQRNLTKLVAKHKLRPDAQGDIEILDAFWNFEDEKPIPKTVPPLLVYADLLATLDPRNLEAAKLINDQYLTIPEAQA